MAKTYVESSGATVQFHVPKKQKDENDKLTVEFRTLNINTKKIEDVLTKDIEAIFREVKCEINFISRTNKFGMMEVSFKTEQIAKKYATKNITSEKWRLFHMYTEKKVVRVRIGGIPPKIKEEWVVASLLKDIKIISISNTQVVDWWEYSLEVFLSVSEKIWKELPQVFVCGEQRLSVVIEGRPLICFRCNKEGHLRKKCEVGTNE